LGSAGVLQGNKLLLSRYFVLRILQPIPSRLHNWTYRDVTDFLREHGIGFHKELYESHEAWIKRGVNNEKDIIVELNFTHIVRIRQGR
jgi:hypothetical protein